MLTKENVLEREGQSITYDELGPLNDSVFFRWRLDIDRMFAAGFCLGGYGPRSDWRLMRETCTMRLPELPSLRSSSKMHTGPGLPAGKFATRTGPLMAGVGRFEVKFLGAGGHSGLSAIATTDLTIVQANFILGLQTIVEGGLGSKEPAMIRVGSIFGGQREAPAVMPTELYVGGTLRTFTPEVQSFMEHRIDELAHSSAKKQGATAEVNICWSSPPLINPGEQTAIAVRAAQVVVGIENVITEGKPITAGEDFAFLLKARPGAFVFLGNGVAEDGSFHNIHTPYYNFNDEVIPTGMAYWVSLVHEELGVD